jgi:hypothetical protein
MKGMRTAWVLLGLTSTATVLGAALNIHSTSPDRIMISWPVSPRAVLEERASFSPQDSWRSYAGTSVTRGEFNVVEATPEGRQRYFRLREIALRQSTQPDEISPAPGEGGVAVTRETIVRFSRSLRADTVLGSDRMFAVSGGRRMLSRVELSSDRRTATLFFLENLPAASRVQVTLNTEGLRDEEGEALDGDGDGVAGGVGGWSFDTADLTGLPGTALVGRVFASERRNGTNVPLSGVTITVDGAEETLRATTGADGVFRLEPCPAGRFFVHVDGRTAAGSRWPGGAYYPFVGKAWEAEPGRTNNLAGGTGEVFLPLVAAATLQPVSPTETTLVTFPPEVIAGNPALAGVRVEVPPNALYADSGVRGGQIGIAPVSPDRLPESLPPGLNPPIVFTIQSDGPMNFDRPVAVWFPNLPDPGTGLRLPAGARTAIWSFNHDTGRWEVAGPATVSADGNFVVSDPGTGVRQPGWTTWAQGTQLGEPGGGPRGGSGAGGGGGGAGGGGAGCPEAADQALDLGLDLTDCLASLAGIDQWISAGTELIRNIDTLVETTERMAEATGVDSTSCDRFAALAAQLNASGQLMADLAKPFVSEADPTRLGGAVVGCGVSLARNASSMACAANCRRGTTTNQRCEDFEALENAGLELGGLVDTDLRDPDSATDLAFGLVETSGNALVASLDAYCNTGGSRAGLASTDPRLLALRGRAIEHRNAVREARAKAIVLLEAGREVRRRLADWLGGGIDMVAGWMIEDRAWAGAFYRLSSAGEVFRSRVSGAGEFRLPPVLASSTLVLEVYEPVRAIYGRLEFNSADPGRRTVVPVVPIVSVSDRRRFPDSDGDGLPDAIEAVVGSRPDRADTDGDGRDDRSELAVGGDPTGAGGSPADGITANRPVPGHAIDLAEIGPETLAVVTAAGSLHFFASTDPDAPLLAGSLMVGTRAMRLAGGPGLLLVSEDSTGIRLYDVSDPVQPRLRWNQAEFSRVGAMAIVRDRALYVSGRNLFARDLVSGTEIFRAEVGSAESLLPVPGGVAVLVGSELKRFGLMPDGILPRVTVTLPDLGIPGGEWGRPWVEGERLGVVGGVSGLVTLTASVAGEWVVRGRPVGEQPVVLDLALLDEQRLAAVVQPPRSGLSEVGILDVSDPADVSRRMATYATPGMAQALVWHRGRIFVADGPAGLTVIRHDTVLPPRGAPALVLSGDFTAPPGQEAHAPYTLRAALAGGHQGQVEFFVNGRRLGRTPRYPHLFSGTSPARTATETNLVFTARAVTTGGVTVESAPLVVPLTQDLTAPRSIEIVPGQSAIAGIGSVRRVEVTFSEALDSRTVNEASLAVVVPGADGVFDTADDAVVGGELEIPARVRTLARVFANPLPPGSYRVRLAGTLADGAGNVLAGLREWDFSVETPRQWISDVDGLWGVAANWLDEELPRRGASVLIDRAASDPVVTFRNNPAFALNLRRLICRESLVLDGGLLVDDLAVFEGPLWITNSSRLESARRIEIRGPVTWSGRGTPTLRAAEFRSAGQARVQLADGQMLSLYASPGPGGEYVNEETGRFEMVSAGRSVLNGFGSDLRFINRGAFHAVAPTGGTNRWSNFFAENQGLISVDSGTLELAFGLTNRGRIVVPVGSRLVISGHRFESTPDAVLTGGGDVQIGMPTFRGLGAPVVGGLVDLQGLLTVLESERLHFLGGRVRLNRLEVANNDLLFRPLEFSARSVVVRWGTLTLASATPVELPEFVTEFTGSEPVSQRLRAETPVTITGPSRLQTLWVASSVPVRFASSVDLTGLFKIGSMFPEDPLPGRVEFSTPPRISGDGEVEITTEGELRLLPGLDWPLPEGTGLRIYGTLINEGTLRTGDGLTGTANAAQGGQVINQGLLETRSGGLRLPRVRQTAGRVRLSGGSLACLQGLHLEGGELEGAGPCLADLSNSGGTVSPGGDSIGALGVGQDPDSGIGGSFTQSDVGRLLVQIAALDRHDAVSVRANARLGGVLEVRVVEAYAPRLGDTFTLLTCGGALSGGFAETRLPELPGGLEFAVLYEANAVKLRVRAR